MFGAAAGSVPALLLTARILHHLRSAPVCVVTALIFSASLPLIGVVDTMWQLAGVLMALRQSGTEQARKPEPPSREPLLTTARPGPPLLADLGLKVVFTTLMYTVYIKMVEGSVGGWAQMLVPPGSLFIRPAPEFQGDDR